MPRSLSIALNLMPATAFSSAIPNRVAASLLRPPTTNKYSSTCSRHKPFEHIYRHHRRYRITEGSEEIQMRRVAGYMFGFMKQRAPKGVTES